MNLKKLNSIFYLHKKLFLSLIIFFTIFFILGLPFTRWAPYKDDYGNLYRSRAKNFTEFCDFFIHGDTETICLGCYENNQSFLQAYYRPMLFVYTFVQKYFFGLNYYYFYLFMIFIHAINSVIIFNIFIYFLGYFLAFLASLYFAFHPSLNNWLGWFGGLQFHMHLLLFLLSIIFLKKYLDSQKIYFYIISCFFYLINIFSGELPIIMPIWVTLAIYIYQDLILKNKINFLKKLLISFKNSLNFWFISIFYIITKLYLYPFRLDVQKYTYYQQDLKFIIFNKFFNIVTCLSDFFNLSFFYCSGQRILKSFFIFYLIIFIAFLFYENKNKKILIFLFLSTIIFLWPIILIKYCNRYIYLALTFFILAIFYCLKYFKNKKILIFILSILIIINSTYLFKVLKKRELFLYQSDQAIKILVKKNNLDNKDLCFIDLPKDRFCEGFTQALKLYFDNKSNNLSFGENKTVITWDYKNNNFVILNKN
ncbi:MAG: hypothetical protein WC436_05155 [Candidatus Babeliales bacterium]